MVFEDGAPVSSESANERPSGRICDDPWCVFAPHAGAATAGTLGQLKGENPVGDWKLCAGDARRQYEGWLHQVFLTLQ